MAKSQNIPDGMIQLLSEADKRNGFPPGTMFSIMKQESGGHDKYISDPTAYHYQLNADGKRIAGHTGKVSTAFGPFGILESTAAQPGYGVVPLKDKSIEEQVRFASDYLAARSKSAGSLNAGIAGYGEGTKYANQVVSRRDKTPMPANTPVAVAANAAPAAEPVIVAAAQPQEQVNTTPAQEIPAVVAMNPVAIQNPWESFSAQAQQAAPVQVTDLAYGQGGQPAITVPDFMKIAAAEGVQPQAAWNMGSGKALKQRIAATRQFIG